MMKSITYLLIMLSVWSGFYMEDYLLGTGLTIMALAYNYVESTSTTKLL